MLEEYRGLTNEQTQALITASQEAYAARPFVVRWVDSHSAGTYRFHTYYDAFEYVQYQWERIRKTVKQERYRASALRQSYLQTPYSKISLLWLLLAEDVSSY